MTIGGSRPEHRPGQGDGGRRVLAAGALALLAALTIAFFAGTDHRGRTARLQADAWYYHAWLPSLVLDRDLDLSNQYEVFGNFYGLGRTETGRPSNVFGVGPALFELPFFVAGHLFARASGVAANGFSRPEVEASLYASVVFSFGAVFFAWRLLRRRIGGTWGPAVVATLTFLGGPAVYYAVRQTGYAHPFAAMFTAWLVDALDRSFEQRARPRTFGTWVGLGTLVGLSALARPQLALWGVPVALAAVDDARRAACMAADDPRARLGPLVWRWAAGAAAAVVAFSPQILVWKSVYGRFLLTPQGEGFLRWDAPAWSEVLFASRNGLLPWTPLYAMALIGLVASLRRWPWTGGALLIGTILQVLANGAAWDWWAGGAYGARRFDSCYAAFAFGLGWLLVRREPVSARLARAAAGFALALAVLLAAANLLLVARRSGANVPIGGGRAAAELWRREIPAPLGGLAAAASSAANLPARLAFAWRHDVPLETYDRVVGVHMLDDRFPGLNADPLPPWRRIALDPRAPNVFGTELVLSSGQTSTLVRLPEGLARVLVGFNRRGEVQFLLGASSGSGDAVRVTLRFNGEPLASAQVGPEPTRLVGRVEDVPRGTSVLSVEAQPDVRLIELTVFSPVDAHGRVWQPH